MKAKGSEEKKKIKLRFAVGLSKALEKSQFGSFRDLSIHLGFEPSHIQRIATGKVDIALTTSIALAEGLGITYQKLSSYYDDVTDVEIKMFLELLSSRKRTRNFSSSNAEKNVKTKKRK